MKRRASIVAIGVVMLSVVGHAQEPGARQPAPASTYIDPVAGLTVDGAIARAAGGALVVVNDPMFYENRVRIIELTLRSRVPSSFGGREFVAAGGLMSYLSSNAWHWRTAASFVDKILRGAKPADIPVEQPTKFELAINLKTAGALGVTIPDSILLRADEVIR